MLTTAVIIFLPVINVNFPCNTLTAALDWNNVLTVIFDHFEHLGYIQKGIIFCKIKILKCKFAKCVITQKYLTDSTARYYFIHFWSYDNIRNERKSVSRVWENGYLSSKNPRAARAL